MEEKIQVLGVELDNCSVKDAMKRVVEHMQMERMNVVEMVTLNTLARFQESEEKELFESFDVVFPGDRGILEAAGVTDERRLKEVEELLLVKMIMRYLQKNKIRVFLVTKTEEEKELFEDYVSEEYGRLEVVGSVSLEFTDGSDDMLSNMINGIEVECVLSTLPSPLEETLVAKNKALIDARIWLGFGTLLKEINKEKNGLQKLKEKILRTILKKEVEKERKSGGNA